MTCRSEPLRNISWPRSVHCPLLKARSGASSVCSMTSWPSGAHLRAHLKTHLRPSGKSVHSTLGCSEVRIQGASVTQISLNHDQVRVVHDNPMHVATWLRRPSDSLLLLVMNQCVLRARTHTHTILRVLFQWIIGILFLNMLPDLTLLSSWFPLSYIS